eukprot:3896405-Prymnesium_polylepis.1
MAPRQSAGEVPCSEKESIAGMRRGERARNLPNLHEGPDDRIDGDERSSEIDRAVVCSARLVEASPHVRGPQARDEGVLVHEERPGLACEVERLLDQGAVHQGVARANARRLAVGGADKELVRVVFSVAFARHAVAAVAQLEFERALAQIVDESVD